MSNGRDDDTQTFEDQTGDDGKFSKGAEVVQQPKEDGQEPPSLATPTSESDSDD